MSNEVDPGTVAQIDTVEAVHYAEGMGESIAKFYTTMVENGLPHHIAEAAVVGYIESRFAPTVVHEEDEDE